MNADLLNEMLALENNQKAQEKLTAAQTAEEAVEILASYGISVNAEDLAALTGTASETGELNEEDLTQISGGYVMPWWLRNLFGRGGGFSSGGGQFGGGGGGHRF